MRLQQCDVMITYLPGFQQHIADMLSRHGKNMNDFAKHMNAQEIQLTA